MSEHNMDELEVQAHWICCPWCDRKTCNRNADDCDVKKWIEKKEKEADKVIICRPEGAGDDGLDRILHPDDKYGFC